MMAFPVNEKKQKNIPLSSGPTVDGTDISVLHVGRSLQRVLHSSECF